MYSVNASFSEEQVKLDGTRPVTMYVLNASLSGDSLTYYVDNNQDVYGWKVNATKDTLCATTQLYTGLDIGIDSIDTNISGEIGDINITIPNTNRVIESLIQNYDYMRSRDIRIITTFSKFLPTGSGSQYIGVNPDHHVSIVEKYYVDSAASDEKAVTFICKSKFDIKGVVVPARKFSHQCAWEYNNTECSPNGIAAVATYPTCGYTLSDCRVRRNSQRFGGFPSIPRRGIYIV